MFGFSFKLHYLFALARSYSRSEMKINGDLFCISLTYS